MIAEISFLVRVSNTVDSGTPHTMYSRSSGNVATCAGQHQCGRKPAVGTAARRMTRLHLYELVGVDQLRYVVPHLLGHLADRARQLVLVAVNLPLGEAPRLAAPRLYEEDLQAQAWTASGRTNALKRGAARRSARLGGRAPRTFKRSGVSSMAPHVGIWCLYSVNDS